MKSFNKTLNNSNFLKYGLDLYKTDFSQLTPDETLKLAKVFRKKVKREIKKLNRILNDRNTFSITKLTSVDDYVSRYNETFASINEWFKLITNINSNKKHYTLIQEADLIGTKSVSKDYIDVLNKSKKLVKVIGDQLSPYNIDYNTTCIHEAIETGILPINFIYDFKKYRLFYSNDGLTTNYDIFPQYMNIQTKDEELKYVNHNDETDIISFKKEDIKFVDNYSNENRDIYNFKEEPNDFINRIIKFTQTIQEQYINFYEITDK